MLLATIGLIVPMALYLLRPQTSTATLERWRTWLLRNQHAVGAILLLVIGFSLGMRGVQGYWCEPRPKREPARGDPPRAGPSLPSDFAGTGRPRADGANGL